ncbi:secreted transmembrane peptide 6 isoform X1 [Raphanus sativus]|uniref:Secreted transmembrane peptide 6 isoform X1 n=1 Tax=Raphanus sativus TaxID=3726 RepID=A0A6J0NJA8_RAPSA|nr:secreted transmembrane peptide 6 isoform X1 [Raphanus sativus]
MGSKSLNIAALVLPLLLILFTLSSQARLVESTGRKLAVRGFGGAPIIWTPPSNSCGASPAVWYPKPTKPRPCRRSPGIGIPTSYQSP